MSQHASQGAKIRKYSTVHSYIFMYNAVYVPTYMKELENEYEDASHEYWEETLVCNYFKSTLYRHYVLFITVLSIMHYTSLKGTGTRDLIWLKVVSLDRSWLVGLTDDL